MKRVLFGLVVFTAMISLPLGALFVDNASAAAPDVQIVFTTSSGEYLVDMDNPGDLDVLGDPDDAITGNRGPESLGGLLEYLPGLIDDDGNLDMVAIQMILDLISDF